MTPRLSQSADIYGENEKMVHALVKAVVTSKVPKVVLLSGIGAHLPSGTGGILKLHHLENEFFKLPVVSVASLRAAWFYENVLGNLKPAQATGSIYSFRYPLHKRIPQVASKDIGKLAAEVLEQHWEGHRIIDVHGPRDYSMNDIAKVFSTVLGKPIDVITVEPKTYAETYKFNENEYIEIPKFWCGVLFSFLSILGHSVSAIMQRSRWLSYGKEPIRGTPFSVVIRKQKSGTVLQLLKIF
eukprot:TRINITY_DN3384_c0_g1_i7.p1 TRINITY_DN3384_c0_g1~~TRINITY_DN3384_c0_g1_i7.p1  ORF type:complete len:241 (-),score=20.69 TRINITY_DN3384_c0_g1_i7:154-876(-)